MSNESFLIKINNKKFKLELIDGVILFVVEITKNFQRTVNAWMLKHKHKHNFKKGEKYLAVYMHTGPDEEQLDKMGFKYFVYPIDKKDKYFKKLNFYNKFISDNKIEC